MRPPAGLVEGGRLAGGVGCRGEHGLLARQFRRDRSVESALQESVCVHFDSQSDQKGDVHKAKEEGRGHVTSWVRGWVNCPVLTIYGRGRG